MITKQSDYDHLADTSFVIQTCNHSDIKYMLTGHV